MFSLELIVLRNRYEYDFIYDFYLAKSINKHNLISVVFLHVGTALQFQTVAMAQVKSQPAIMRRQRASVYTYTQ